MIPYLGLNVVIAGLWIFSRLKETENCHICVGKRQLCTTQEMIRVMAVIIVALFMGLRGPFTSDHKNYMGLFYETLQRSLSDIVTKRVYTERGYLVFNKAISIFTHDANVFMCIEAIVYIVAIMIVAKKSKCDDFLMFTLLFVNAGIYFQSFNMIRQAFAACIVFSALKRLGDGNKRGYIILVLLATTIHTSSIIMLLALPLLQLRINLKNGLKMVCIGVVSLLSLGKVIELVQKYRYANYSYGMGHGTINAFLVQWAICILVLIAIYNRQVDVQDGQNIVLINSMWLYIISSVATLNVYQMSRICYFFSTPMLLLASNAIGTWPGKSGLFLRVGVVALLVLYSYVWLSGTGYDPYYTFFS